MPERVCESCGDDLAVEGYRACLDCLEQLGSDGDLMALPRIVEKIFDKIEK